MSRRIIYIIILFTSTLCSRETPHFYYARTFPGEPRFEKPWLTEGYIHLIGASSEHSYDIEGGKQNVFDIYGRHDPTTWADELSDLSPTTSSIDHLIDNIRHIDIPDLTVDGKFQLLQFDIRYTQNFDHGIFTTVCLPVYHIETSRIHIKPESQILHPRFNDFIQQLPAILDRLGFDSINHEQSALGDISLLMGYTHNYENTTQLDFIDTTLQAGILAPSGHVPNPRKLFDIPTGYYDRTGFILEYTGAVGLYDWLTFGLHSQAIILAPTTLHNRIHTVADGKGWITPRTATFHLASGHVWTVNIYTKADHVLQGFSVIFGYSYDRKEPSHVTPRNADARDDVMLSHDRRFQGWNKHTFHWLASYDFAHENNPSAPEVSVFCNHTVDGNQIFESSVGGVSIGCNITFAH